MTTDPVTKALRGSPIPTAIRRRTPMTYQASLVAPNRAPRV